MACAMTANGVSKDKAAVSAAIALPWSNGQTEGQITKLKLVKRQMYGRGKLDLLQARLLGAD
jgi:transposase